MLIYPRNIPAKFHPDPIWNNVALFIFWRRSPQEEEEEEDEEEEDDDNE